MLSSIKSTFFSKAPKEKCEENVQPNTFSPNLSAYNQNRDVRGLEKDVDCDSFTPLQESNCLEDFDSNYGNLDEYRLFSALDTPTYLQREFIRTRYRVHLSYRLCISSLFRVHNESGNVWTHFVGFWLIVAVMIHAFSFDFSPMQLALFAQQRTRDYGMLSLFFASAMICFLFSTMYHLFKCHSRDSFKHFSQLDYLGISVFITGCLISTIYFGFYCYPSLQHFYVTTCLIFCIITTVVANMPAFLTPSLRIYRIIAFVSHVSFSIVPLVHWVIKVGIYSEEASNTLWRVLVTFLLFGLGFFFYISKIPERFDPGRFDVAFQSHQIWHVFVVIAACWQYYTIVAFIEPKLKTGCPAVL